MKDKELLVALKAGDTSALMHCYEYLPLVKHFILKNSGSEEDAYDVFQDTVMAFYKNAIKENFELSAALSTYLLAISKNIWMSKLKKRSREEQVKFQIGQHGITSESFDAEDDSLDEKIESVVNSLKEPCKTILFAFYFQNMNLTAIAKKLNYQSEQVARQQKYRCMKKIKEIVKSSLK